MFHKKLNFNFLGKKTNTENKETAASDSGDKLEINDALYEKPNSPKSKLKLVAMLAILLVFSTAASYLYLGGLFKEPLKPIQGITEMPMAQSPLPMPDGANVITTPQNNQIAISPTPQPHMPAPSVKPVNDVAPHAGARIETIPQRQTYIPARDILAGTADLQAARERIEKLELDLKARKLEKELTQVMSEISLVPIQTEAQRVETATRIAERNVRPVDVPVRDQNIIMPPPSLIYTTGDTATLQMPTGEQIRVRVGNAAGDYTVTAIRGSTVVLTDRKGRQTEITMRLPDSFPVHPSMFGNRPTGTVIGPPVPPGQQQQDFNQPFPQPQFVPIPTPMRR